MRASEIGDALREQRISLGLTQEQLALFAAAAPQTIAQIEAGVLAAVCYDQLARVLNVVGLQLQLARPRDCAGALAIAARAASTSYKQVLSPQALLVMLTSGEVPAAYQPHVLALLDEVPVPLVLRALQDASQCSATTVPHLLRHLAHWATTLNATRRGWHGTH